MATTLKDSLTAVVFDRFGRAIFSPADMPEHLRPEIVGRFGGRIVEGVYLNVPEGVNRWPDGAPAPEEVLCVSRSDPKHYEVFKYSGEVDRAAFEPTGLDYSVIGSEDAWETFVATLRKLDDIAREAGEGEPEGGTEEFMRGVDANRAPGQKLYEGMY
jgi:hypothetical protein